MARRGSRRWELRAGGFRPALRGELRGWVVRPDE